MAIVILFGLLTSMLLNMLIVPALYLRFGRPVEPGQEGGPDETHAFLLWSPSPALWRAAPSRPHRSFFRKLVAACR